MKGGCGSIAEEVVVGEVVAGEVVIVFVEVVGRVVVEVAVNVDIVDVEYSVVIVWSVCM